MLEELIATVGVEVETEYAEVFARLDSAKIERTEFEAEELMAVFIGNMDAIKQYSINKFNVIPDDEDDEEYPVGAAPTGDEKSKTLSVGKYSQGFY